MKRSSNRIITTHCGSLPRPEDLIAMLATRDAGDDLDQEAVSRRISESIGAVVRRQAEAGIDVVNDGEHSKTSFTSYTSARLAGLVATERPPVERRPSRDEIEFAGVYEEQRAMYAARPSN